MDTITITIKMASEDADEWEKSCKVWSNSDGSIYSATFSAPAPSKNFLQIYINATQVSLRIWKILPPTRANSNQAPSQILCTYSEFLDDEKMRGEIDRNMGPRELAFIDGVVNKHLDWLNKLPRKVLLRICFFLDLASIARLGQVNKLFRELCSCDALWSKIYMDHTKKQVSQELLMLVDQRGWKEVFFMNKLQLQMQMRRTAKESRFHYGNKFHGSGSKDNSKSGFFLTSHRPHSADGEEEENGAYHPPPPMRHQLPDSDFDYERLTPKRDEDDWGEMKPPRHQYDDNDEDDDNDDDGYNHPQQRDYNNYEDQTQYRDGYQKGVPPGHSTYRYKLEGGNNDDEDDDEDEDDEDDKSVPYNYQYPDEHPKMHHRHQSNMSSPELVAYQE